MTKPILIYIVILFLAIPSCRKDIHPLVPGGVRNTINNSGNNYIEFVEAISNYKDSGDSLKLQSLYFLISHINEHGIKTYLLQDNDGQLIDYNITEFDSYPDILQYKDSIRQQRDSLHFIRHYFGPDKYVMTAKQLTTHLEKSVNTWQSNSWSKNYSFSTFCSKILPYRLNDAHFDSLYFQKDFKAASEFNYSTGNVFDMAEQVMRSMEGKVRFDKRFIEHPTDRQLSWEEYNQEGRTEDAAGLAVNVLRSMGIASAIDYLPFPRESGKYADYWVVVWDSTGKKRAYYPFDNILEKPVRPVKVFRRSFDSYNRPLPDDSIYRLLKYQHLKYGKYRDVTAEYLKTVSWRVTPRMLGEFDKFQPIVLAVRKNKSWLPVDWRYFTKRHLFRELKPGEHYALLSPDGRVLMDTVLNASPDSQEF